MTDKKIMTWLFFSLLVMLVPGTSYANGNGEILGYGEQMEELDQEIALKQKRLEALKLDKEISKLNETETIVGGVVVSTGKKKDPIEKMAVHSVYAKERGKGLDAEIRYGGSVIPVTVGYKLPGNWKVTVIDAGGVKVKRGKKTRVIPVMEEEEPELLIPPVPAMQITPPPAFQ